MGFILTNLMKNKLNVCVVSQKQFSDGIYNMLLEYKKSLYSISEFLIKYGRSLNGDLGLGKSLKFKDDFVEDYNLIPSLYKDIETIFKVEKDSSKLID